ncbi:MAG: DUF1109 domain-containing protein [Burkholderiales bacterium]
MRTDELIFLLARDPARIDPGAMRRRYWVALGLGILAALAMVLVHWGIRPDLALAATLPMFWVKLGFPIALACAALAAVSRLARPARKLGRIRALIAAPIGALWLLALAQLLTSPVHIRNELIFGQSWAECVVSVAALAAPAFAALLWALRGFAPTRLRATGTAAGLLAGAIGAAVYALHCPEMTAPFIGLWYLLGMIVPAVFGFWIGPQILRW